MDLLKNFLSRFEKIKNPKEDKISIANELSQILDFQISSDSIEIKDSVLTISKIHPVIKNTIFLNKEKIITTLKGRCPYIKVMDIK